MAPPGGVGFGPFLRVGCISQVDVDGVSVVDKRQGAGGGLVGVRHIDGRFLGAVRAVLGRGRLHSKLYPLLLVLGSGSDAGWVEDSDEVGGVRFVPEQFLRSVDRAKVVLFEVLDDALLASKGFMHCGYRPFLLAAAGTGGRFVP